MEDGIKWNSTSFSSDPVADLHICLNDIDDIIALVAKGVHVYRTIETEKDAKRFNYSS